MAHSLVDIVGVGGVPCESLLWSAGLSLLEDFSASPLVSLEHLNGEDVVDLNVMGREAVLEEAWWEHHVVSGVPELWLILVVELEHVSLTDESEASQDVEGGEDIGEEGSVVQWSTCHIDESSQDNSSGGDGLQHSDVEPVADLEPGSKGVLAHLTLTNLEESEHITNGSLSLGESLVDNILEALGVLEEPGLKTLRHFSFVLNN